MLDFRSKLIAIICVLELKLIFLGFLKVRISGHPCVVCISLSFSLPLLSFSSLSYLLFFGSWWIKTGFCTSVSSCCRISLESKDIFRCDHFPLSLIVKKVSTSLSDPHCVSNLPLFRSTSALFSPSFCASSLLLLFSPDQLIMPEKGGRYPEVISWVLSGWYISPAWWRNTLLM